MSTSGNESTAPSNSPQPAQWATIRYAGVLVAGILTTWGVWLAVQAYNTNRARHDCRAHLRQIGVALHVYHELYGSFPPAYLADDDGKPLHSWRVLLLPFLGEGELYLKYRFDEPWDSASNYGLAAKIPAVYACPACGGRKGVTNYLALVGRATPWPEQYSARRKDFIDGPSNTIQLLEFPDSDVIWLEPRDRTHQEFTKLKRRTPFPTAHSYSGEGIATCLLADGSVRPISINAINLETLKALLTTHGGRPLARIDWPGPDAGIARLPDPRPASAFRSTDVIPCPTLRIVPGRNLVYCATFELAWENARRDLGRGPGDRIELDGTPAMAELLNGHSFDRRNLSEDSYVAYAGAGTEAARDQIRAEIENKFTGAMPRLLNDISGDYKVLVYAYLLKTLPFETAFDSLEKPLEFRADGGPVAVASFGIEELDDVNARGKSLQSQVAILDYLSNDDFVIRLSPYGARDEIVLAKVNPLATLEETITDVQKRIAKPDSRHTVWEILRTEPLIVPKLTIGVERQFSELMGRDIAGTNMFVALAAQTICFRLDENGAVLESEAAVIADDFGPEFTPPGQRKFIFDRPFLMYLIERGASQPYFAMWVANAEVMVIQSR